MENPNPTKRKQAMNPMEGLSPITGLHSLKHLGPKTKKKKKKKDGKIVLDGRG